MGCNYLSLPLLPASDTTLLKLRIITIQQNKSIQNVYISCHMLTLCTCRNLHWALDIVYFCQCRMAVSGEIRVVVRPIWFQESFWPDITRYQSYSSSSSKRPHGSIECNSEHTWYMMTSLYGNPFHITGPFCVLSIVQNVSVTWDA